MLEFAHDPRADEVAAHVARLLVADLLGQEPPPPPKPEKREPTANFLESELFSLAGKLEKRLRKEGWSAAELDFCRRELRRFTEWAVAQPDLKSIEGLSREAMFRYEAHLRSDAGGGVKAATAHILLRPVRKLFALLSDATPAAKKRVAGLRAATIVELLESMDPLSPWALRDRAALLLLCRDGVPASVVDNLRLEDLCLEESRLRQTSLNPETVASLSAYLAGSKVARKQLGVGTQLFFTQRGSRFQTARLARGLRHHARRAGVELPSPFGVASLRPQPNDEWPEVKPLRAPESELVPVPQRVARLLAVVDTAEPVGLMDIAIVHLLVSTSLSLDELGRLPLHELCLEPEACLGSLALDPEPARALKAYLRWCRPHLAAPVETGLFVSKSGTRFRTAPFRTRLRDYCRQAGFPEKDSVAWLKSLRREES